MSIEAMKQALEALERSVATCFDQYAHRTVMSQPDHFINQAITSLRQAIAEAEKQDGNCQRCGGEGCIACDAREQEPVAIVTSETGADITMSWWHEPALPIGTKLYTHPQPKREWVGLTDEEIQEIALELPMDAVCMTEAKLKEKNT